MSTSSLSGRRVGSFDVGALIGAGGMGEVYRGRDFKLNRDVAIKVLLPAVANDAERLARFNREAQVLASLNHPNIGQIHGITDSDSGPLLILEFVEGPTLADRIARGPLPMDEAIAIAKQIADALEAAHERGIVHRDLKPANIKVDEHGGVKVLDFGLAKAAEQGLGTRDQGSGDLANSPTITSPAMTQAGLILGTAAYMSPEQAKGRPVDKRSDVWAFGCVLYEMLTGTRAFGGEDVTDTIAAVVRGEPDWTKLPASTPSQIQLLLKRCLEKDRKARISDVGVARFLLNENIEAPGASAAAGGTRRAPVVAIAALLLGAILGAGAWALSSRTNTSPPSVVHFELRPPDSTRILLGAGLPMAVAPDGSFAIYRAMRPEGEGRQADVLMIHTWKELEPRELPDTRLARAPFISPDGKWIGFFAPQRIRKVPVAGGQAVDIAEFRGLPFSASWGDDGYIVFSTSEVEGLQRVSANGGEVTALTTPARSKRDRHVTPHVLPGSRFVLFTEVDSVVLNWTVQAVEVATGAVKTVMADAYQAAYMNSGHLLYATTTPMAVAQRQGRASVRAVRFNSDRAEPIGEPVTVAEPVGFAAPTMIGSFAVSPNGVLVYFPEVPSGQSPERQLVWVDRNGVETPIPVPQRDYGIARLSPDGGKVVMDVVRQDSSGIWIWDLNRQTFSPVNREPSLNTIPIWMPDGRRVIWSSTRDGSPKLFAQAADGTGQVERISTGAGTQFATSVSSDGRTVLMFGTGLSATGSFDIGTVTLGGGPADPKAIVATPERDFGGELSPDGKWLAYHSTESGESQVYVRPYPNVDAGRWQVSNAGGSRAVWSRDGRELFYLNRQGFLTSVAILPAAGGEFSAGLPKQILKTAYVPGRTTLGLDVRAYDVSPDGQRFLMLKEVEQEDRAQPPRLAVMLNLVDELKARLP